MGVGEGGGWVPSHVMHTCPLSLELPWCALFFFFFLAALGPCCCVWAFSSYGDRELLFIAVHGSLTAVVSLVEHGL